ncbi:hypothetical protein QOT17_010919, partial [Balamuthia mandrillaris]
SGITAEAEGSIAMGAAQLNGVIIAKAPGAFATGYAIWNGTIRATDIGAHASGVAFGGNSVAATAPGSFAHGINIRTSTIGGMVAGRCNNPTDEESLGTGEAVFAVGVGDPNPLTGLCDSSFTGMMLDSNGDLFLKGDIFLQGTVSDSQTLNLRSSDESQQSPVSLSLSLISSREKMAALEAELKDARQQLATTRVEIEELKLLVKSMLQKEAPQSQEQK